MSTFKRFKQSYRDTINPTIQSFKESCGWTNKRIAYGLDLGEMYEWANGCLPSAWLYKECVCRERLCPYLPLDNDYHLLTM